MRLTGSAMKYKNIMKRLHKGVALADRETKISGVSKFHNKIERTAFTAARATGQLEGLGDFGMEDDLLTQIKTGAIFPDEYYGFSTKTILAALLVAMIFRVKSLKGA